jgi:hypothetical protein
MNLAIMQPCYLPWRGYFSLMKHADLFVHLDHVPLPQGRSVQTRIAIKTARGRQWLTLPVRHESHQRICDVQFADDRWRRKHWQTLEQTFGDTAKIVEDLYATTWTHLADFNIALIDRLAERLNIARKTWRSSTLGIEGHGSDLILNLCRQFGATRYFTGHGARNYLDHEAFERAGIDVMYMDYDLSPYPQPHGDFDPFVTVLDVLAHAPNPQQHIAANAVHWRQFLMQAA